jgi:hypothetical protein
MLQNGRVLVRRTHAESSGVWTAVACVAFAVLLYVIVALVWGSSDDDDDGVLSTDRSRPTIVA